MGRNLASDPIDVMALVESNADTLSNRFKYLITMIQAAWSSFQNHYLTELREHHMYTRPKTDDVNMLKVGDVVIIKDEKVRSRSCWRLGRIESLVVGKDDKVRGVNLQTISKQFHRTKMSRPLQKIIPLEIVSTTSDEISSVPASVPANDPLGTVVSEPRRSKRTYAVNGEAIRRASNQK